MKFLNLFFLSLLLLNCTKTVKEIIEVPVERDASVSTGTDTGGGGFADKDAINALNLAKHALAQRIENLPEASFSPYSTHERFQFGLPEDKRKAWLSKIIRGIEVRRVYEKRYGKPLKFNYDIEEEKVYATNYFLDAFRYSKFENLPAKEKVRIVHDLFIDVLHEVSHFYGVGKSEETDAQSEKWALDFLNYGMDSFYKCVSENDYIFMINKSTGKIFVRYDPLEAGTSLIIYKTPELQYMREVDPVAGHWGLKVMHLPQEDHWRTNTGMIPLGDTSLIPEDYVVKLYDQYVLLALEKGSNEVPLYLKSKERNAHDPDIGIGRINYWLGQDNWSGWNFSGFLFGYPELNESSREYKISKEGLLKKDHFSLDMDSLVAVYSFGKRGRAEESFTFKDSDKLEFQCQDFNKKLIFSLPTE